MRGWPGLGLSGFGGPVIMLIFALIIIGVLVYMAVAVSRNNTGRSGGRSGRINTDGALEIMEERYARGELSKEDFVSMRKTLRS
jgi:putative membrane protein